MTKIFPSFFGYGSNTFLNFFSLSPEVFVLFHLEMLRIFITKIKVEILDS